MRRVRLLFVIVLVGVSVGGICAQALANEAAKMTADNLTIDVLSYTEYPSMMPVVAVRVHLKTLQVADDVKQAIADHWDCSKSSSYRVSVQGSDTPLTIAVVRLLPLTPSTVCGDQPDVLLQIRAPVDVSDKITVSLQNLPKSMAIQSKPTAFEKGATSNTFGLRVTPQSAPGETLTTGSKRDVGQLNVALTAPDLIPSFRRGAVYAKSVDLFSTDERDSKSAFSGVLGISRGVLRNWYSPVHFEENVEGNQTATNLSAVSSVGMTTLTPWFWTRKILNNSVVNIPNPPEFTIDASYTHRINQNVTAKTPLLRVDDFDLNPSATLAPIHIAPGLCKALHRHFRQSDESQKYCLGVELDEGMWYLPFDKTKSGSQRAEGYGDVSFLIPISDIPFQFLGSLISNNPASAQFRIKYSDTVNAANNYARTRQWTFGIELMK